MRHSPDRITPPVVADPKSLFRLPINSPEHWAAHSGEWTDASRWSGGEVPDESTVAVIARGGRDYTVHIGSSAAVDVLRIKSSAATLAVNAALQLGKLLQLDAGTVSLGRGSINGGKIDVSSGASFTVSGGILTNVVFEGTLDAGGSHGRGGLTVGTGTTFSGSDGSGRATINDSVSLAFQPGVGLIDNVDIVLGNAPFGASIETTGNFTFGPSSLISVQAPTDYITGTGTITNAGTWDCGYPGGQFVVEHESAIVNTGTIAVSADCLLDVLHSKVQVDFANAGTITSIDGGGLFFDHVSLSNQAGGLFAIANDKATNYVVSGDSKSSFTNAGLVTVEGSQLTYIQIAFSNTGTVSSSGTGGLTFLSSVANDGHITETDGKAFFLDVTGHGTLAAASGGTLALNGASPHQVIDFLAMNSELDLGKPLDFLGTIAGFGAGNTIDLLQTAEDGYSFTGGVLTVTDNGATVASLHFSGSYSTGDFAVSQGQNSDTLITFK